MDRTILATALTIGTIVHYDIAARINGLSLIPQSLPATVTYPAAAAAAAVGDEPGLRRLFTVVARYTASVSALVTVGLMLISEDLIRHWIGPAYRSDAWLARLALLYPLLWASIPVGWNIALAMGALGSLMRISVLTTLLNLALSLLLVRDLGVAGVIAGTAVGNTIAAGLYFPLFLRLLKLSAVVFIRSVLIPAYTTALVAAVPFGVLLQIRPAESLLETALYFAGYLLVGLPIFVLVALEPEHRVRLRVVLGGHRGPSR
jgi:O-antigen/teichoic acid export membrane protein